MAREHPAKIDLRLHNLDDTASLSILVPLEEAHGVESPSPQELFVADTVLLGYQTIMAHAEEVIREYLSKPEQWTTISLEAETISGGEHLRKRLQDFTLLGFVAAGLLDGINPCAIATMIFLISFLATQKRRRGEVLAIGLSFTSAVFATYLLLGIGAFKLLTSLSTYHWISTTVRWVAVAAAGAVALYSFRDAIVYARTRKTGDIKLQLSKDTKVRIHKVISDNLTRRGLVLGAMITGFLVTLLEAVCTGQVYLPTIVLMTQHEGLKLRGWLYLVLYNFLFVLPLLVIMVMAYFGLTWNTLSKTTQKHMVAIKASLGVVMTGLAVFLAVAG